jgi:hypothetical protein
MNMSKADVSTTLIRSRRAVLAGLASAAALPIAAALPTNAEQSADPIFAAIEKHRSAVKACDTAYAYVDEVVALAEQKFGSGDDVHRARREFIENTIGDEDKYSDAAFSAKCDAFEKFCETAPTTAAGLKAMLLRASEVIERDEDAFIRQPIFATLARAAKNTMQV